MALHGKVGARTVLEMTARAGRSRPFVLSRRADMTAGTRSLNVRSVEWPRMNESRR